MSVSNQHSDLVEAMERAHDSWAGRPYPVGPGVSQEFARAVQDRTTLAAEVTRLEEQLETATKLYDATRILDVMLNEPAFEGLTTAEDYRSYVGGAWLGVHEAMEAFTASSPATVLSDTEPPDEDVARAGELARERGWKDIGGEGVVSDPAMCRHARMAERPKYAIDDEPGHYLCLDCGDKLPLIGESA